MNVAIAAANGPSLAQQRPPPARVPVVPKEKLAGLLGRLQQLRQQGLTAETSPEVASIINFLTQYQKHHPIPFPTNQPALNGHVNGDPSSSSLTSGPVPGSIVPPPSQSPVSFTAEQTNALRVQIHAFKLLQRGMPVPENIQQALHVPNSAVPDLDKLLHNQPTDVPARIVDNLVKAQRGESVPVDLGKPQQQSEAPEDASTDGSGGDANSAVYPYNAFRHPFTHLRRPPGISDADYATRLQRLLVPALMPAGLDPHQILAERDRFIEARIQQRIRELEDLPSTLGDGGFVGIAEESAAATNNAATHTAHGKLQAILELKGLRVLEKQRALRAMISERLGHGAMIPLNRSDFRRVRKPTLRDARATEVAERRQRVDRERRAKHKHVEQLVVICDHGREVLAANRAAQDRALKLARAALAYHQQTEKEEQKRIERISKERLKALKADDEEAYMKLIDTAKDTRITHLLKQTDAYLESLAQAVVAQQNEGGPMMPVYSGDVDDGPTNEATFGAQVASEDVVEDKNKIDYYSVAHRIKEKVARQPSILVGGTLKEYQLKGLQWMVSLYNNRLNGILADEMGLGKTIQTISLITFLIEFKKERGPYLVIVPLSTMTNWTGEFAKWAPSVRTISYKGNPQQRRALQGELRTGQFQVLLTTFEYIIKDRPILSKIKWVHMIIDEGHRMKNTQSKLAQTLTTFYHSRYRLILTGTPLQNNLPELWSLLNFALPKIFNSVKSFDEWFNTPFANSGTADKIELNEEEALLIIRRLHKVLRPFLLRRLKKDVESELPDKVEKVIKVKMSALQSQLYRQMKKHKMIADGKEVKGKMGGVKGLSNEIMQLRKICQHPFLFESVEDKINPTGMIDDKLIRTSGKIELLNRILPKMFATGHRVLIFFQMTRVMDIMEDFLKFMGWKYLRLDGGTKTEERAGHVHAWNAKGSDVNVFILSTRAGGLGLNLQTADTVVIFDSDWNPHADLQAQDRAHRIGQTKAVRILRFITEKSVEEAMYARARYKLDIDDKVIQAGRFDNKSTQEEQEEFLRSILEADQEEENEEAGDMNDEELNGILARSDEETVIFRDIDIQRERKALEDWRATGNRGKPPQPLMQFEELPECYQLDEPFENKDSDELVEGRGQRKRNAVNYTDGLDDEQWAMAVEEGEDLEELSERMRKKQQVTNKLLKETETFSRGTPASDDSRGRKVKKGKAKAGNEASLSATGKRKRGRKSSSVSPSVVDDDDDDRDQKRRKTKVEITPAIKDKMKKAFVACSDAVLACVAVNDDGSTRKRCELFRELPNKREYPDYYQLIHKPVSIAQINRKVKSHQYKDVQTFRDDWKTMFTNAKTYNQEGSWVYNDAEEMWIVFENAFNKHIAGSGLPGAPPAAPSSSSNGAHPSASSPASEVTRPGPSRKSSGSRKQILSDDDEYLTQPSDDE